MNGNIKAVVFLLLLEWVSIFGAIEKAEACSDVILNSSNYIISGRTLDLNMDIHSEVVAVPAGHLVQIKDDNGRIINSWHSKYGFVGINALHTDRYNDGLNEKGLSVGTLTLMGTTYPSKENYPGYTCIPINHVAEWILGNFSTTEEVKNPFRNSIIVSDNVPSRQRHLVIHDENGKSMVVEFIDGKIKTYDSTDIKVLTNNPEYPWQVENLKKYADYNNIIPVSNLTNEPERKSGMPDLPGNSTPASRFVRAYFLNKFVAEPGHLQEAVEEIDAIMGRLTILRGEFVLKGAYEHTWWTVIRDHRNRVIYFKDMDNGCLRSIDLKKLNLKNNAPVLRMPLAGEENHQSVEHLLRAESSDK